MNNYAIPLSPFEEYLFRDDRPGYPMTMPMTMVFRGQVDLKLLSQAFDDAVASEPFFTSLVKRQRGRFYWVPADEGCIPRLEDRSDERYEHGESGVETIDTFDLRRAPGVSCQYRTTNDGFAIRLQVHHAICDGLASVRFGGNCFARYGELIGDTEGIAVAFPTAERLLHRGNFDIVLPQPLSRWAIAKATIRETLRWFLHRPSQLVPLSNDRDSRAASATEKYVGNPRLFWTRLPEEFFHGFITTAKRRGLSVNSLFIGDYFQTLYRWIEKTSQGRCSDRQWIRIVMPTNLRKVCHHDIPAANMLGYAFLDRRLRECRDQNSLYAGIQRETDLIKARSAGAIFLDGLRVFRTLPGGLRLTTSKLFCHVTSVLSNVSSPCKTLVQKRFRRLGSIQVGDCSLVQVIGAPPVRPNMPFSVGMLLQDRYWTLAMTSDLAVMDYNETLVFQKLFVEQLCKTAGIS